MTITEFLEARITEDEVSATMRECHRGDCDTIPDESGYSYPCNCGLPERMATECAAKRAIVAEHGDMNADFASEDAICETCHDYHQHCPADWPCPTLRALAAVYSTHPDYRQERAVA